MYRVLLCLPLLLAAPSGFAASPSQAIDSLIAPQDAAGVFSGVVLVARNDEVLFHRAYGLASWELGVPNDESTRFGLGSISKSFTEILAVSLAAENRLQLDAPVERYIPGFPKGPKGGSPTLAHLLSHRSGVPHRVTTAADETAPLKTAEIVERVRSRGLIFEPGSRRLYSSAGYSCLARVIERIEERPFEAILADRIFGPAGMTTAASETGELLMERRALPHRLGAHGSRVVVKRAQHQDLRFLTGAGSVYATALDLFRFVHAMRAGLFGAEPKRRVIGSTRDWLGWAGRTNGYEASVDVLPSEGLVVVLLSNLRPAANWQVREGIQAVLTGRRPAAIALPPPPTAHFEDPRSLIATYGRAAITLVGGDLFRGENESYPIEGGRYYIPASGTLMRFRRDAAGRVDAMISIRGDGTEQLLARSDGS